MSGAVSNDHTIVPTVAAERVTFAETSASLECPTRLTYPHAGGDLTPNPSSDAPMTNGRDGAARTESPLRATVWRTQSGAVPVGKH